MPDLGVRTWLSSRTEQQFGQADKVPVKRVLWRAIVTNLLNPKIILFDIAFLPQFVLLNRRSSQVVIHRIAATVFVGLALRLDVA
ncbi:LysE family translocator [Actinocrispum wychmicini]|uniref:LysE type translocator n=1 Tax=Actinocrispum wychmicini TaxID=1213861 RepID=A0A4R2J5F4_9PSEU|nr:hypothetical protein [Actinocrispum wychmicini]TCO54073.1 hypothetical protein EV192_10953 [Actinocrispum wychmicini]